MSIEIDGTLDYDLGAVFSISVFRYCKVSFHPLNTGINTDAKWSLSEKGFL